MKIENSLKRKTFNGILWSGIERFSVQGLQMLTLLIVARILTPQDFGLVGMLTIFIAVAQSLVDSGFSQALIRKQNRTEEDNSTVFFFNIVISLCLYLILYIIAPIVASFYDEPQLISLMRVLCLVVIINSFSVVQRAIYTAAIDFKTIAKITLLAATVSGGFAIWLALNGYGVWTLVWQQLINALVTSVLLCLFSKWHPHLVFSWDSFWQLFSFGSKLLAGGLLNTIYDNIYQLFIGKIFNARSLGYYVQANNFSTLPAGGISNIIQRVTYPVFCTIQNDYSQLRSAFLKTLRDTVYIVFPVMCLIAGLAKPIVNIMIGNQWENTATMLIPLCFCMMWIPVHSLNLNLLQVTGHSGLFLKLEIIKKIIAVTILLCSIPFGLLFMCYTQILTSLICLSINTFYTGKLLQLGLVKQMREIAIPFCLSLLLFALCNHIVS